MRLFIKLAVLAVAIAVMAITLTRQAGVSKSPAVSEPKGGPHIVIVGLDGFDWGRFERLASEGRVPNLERLREGGAAGMFRSIPPFVSPTIWTSIATGKVGAKHGIGGFTVYGQSRKAVDLELVGTGMLKCRTLWEILAASGRSSGVVGWLVTYPPIPVTSFTVTSHAIVALSLPPNQHLALGDNADMTASVYPSDLWDEISQLGTRPAAIPESDVTAILGPTDGVQPDLLTGPKEIVARRLAADRTTIDIARHLMAEHPTDLAALYLRGPDIISHFFWRYYEPSSWTRGKESPEIVAALGPVIDNYYAAVDGMVGELLGDLDDNTIVIVCSDHGFAGHRGHPGFHPEHEGDMAFGVEMHRQEGTIIMNGPGVRSGYTINGATVLDVTPTVLDVFGLPIARDMDGKPLTAAFEQSFQDHHPVNYVDSYEVGERVKSEGPAQSPVDDDIKEMLRSLGYIN